MYTIGKKKTIPAGDFLSPGSLPTTTTITFRQQLIDNEKREGDETTPNQPSHYVQTGEKYWECARVILVTFILI